MITVKDMRTSLGIECGRALGVVARLVVAQAAGGVAKHHGNVVADFKGEAGSAADELAALAVALQKPALADRTDVMSLSWRTLFSVSLSERIKTNILPLVVGRKP